MNCLRKYIKLIVSFQWLIAELDNFVIQQGSVNFSCYGLNTPQLHDFYRKRYKNILLYNPSL